MKLQLAIQQLTSLAHSLYYRANYHLSNTTKTVTYAILLQNGQNSITFNEILVENIH